MRETCLELIHQLARRDPRVVFIGSDLGVGTLKKFREEMPDRFFMEGVGEANMIGMAAGLAMNGKIPYLNTIATFLTRRCFEQVVLDVAHARLKVRLVGSGGGLVYAPLGPTHLATDDLAVMRAIPHMTILAPADADEMRRVMPHTLDHEGPIYLRLAKGRDPIVTPADEVFAIGAAVPLREGADALVLTTGIGLRACRPAVDELVARGVDVALVHLPTVKPLDRDAILERAARVRAVVTVEEHTLVGGLGSAVAELLAEADLAGTRRFRRLALPDEFVDDYGSQDGLMARYGLTAERVAATVAGLLG